ncbi:hypothetical protein HMPREF1631_04110 [Arcanobacterium sp. S3PF19]|nr:hypothetical protein HMPREF1631_04110 [Arcanobacterium sp. S3PF19]
MIPGPGRFAQACLFYCAIPGCFRAVWQPGTLPVCAGRGASAAYGAPAVSHAEYRSRKSRTHLPNIIRRPSQFIFARIVSE